MDNRLSFVLMVAVMVVAPVLSQNTGQSSQCLRTYQANVMNCAQNGSMNYQHLLYLTSNRTQGSMPPEGISQFQMRACRVHRQIDQCGQMMTSQLLNSTLCINGMDRQEVMTKASSFFGDYDTVCAHPCRYTLLDQLRQCFSSNQLDPRTFIDNAWGKGAVIGMNRHQVYQFCKNQQMLMNCITQKTSMCQDSPIVFSRMGMDVSSMQEGIKTLCMAPNVYLAGISCFLNPTPEVQMCLQSGNLKWQSIRMQYKQMMNENVFKMQTCGARLEQVDCELGAWSRRQHEKCDKAIVGLRNELECKILPKLCMRTHPQLYNRLCSPMNFHLEERRRYSSAGSVVVTWSTIAIFIVSAIYFK